MELHHAFARTLYRFLLMCFMFEGGAVASAATMYLPATSTTGNFTISWTSGKNAINVYENRSTGGVLLAEAGPNSSYKVTGKPNGTYTYYLLECVPNGQPTPICTQSNPMTINVTLPSQNPAPAAPASASSGGASENEELETKTAKLIEAVISASNVDSVNINRTTGGVCALGGHHDGGWAVDINRVDGKPVDASNSGAARIQESAKQNPSTRENFGPHIMEKRFATGAAPVPFGTTEMKEFYKTHIHISVQQ